jgi:hypothetical protein
MFPKWRGIPLPAERLSAFEEELRFMDLVICCLDLLSSVGKLLE